MILTNSRLLGGVAVVALLAALSGFGLARCSGGKPAPIGTVAAGAQGGKTTKGPPNTVAMKPEAVRAAGILVEPVNAGGLEAEILGQATVTAAPTGQAVLTARASGAVTHIFKRLGDPVRAGETLAIVESRDAAQIAADRAVASAKVTLAQKNLAREKYLLGQRVSPRQDYEQAQAEAASAAAEARRAQAAAGAAHVTSDGRGVAVASPISGRVTAVSASLGAFVQPETELFRVADPRQIQIEAAVPALDAQRISPGDRASVQAADGRSFTAVVRATTPSLNPETRAGTVVLALAQGAANLQPGQLVQVRIMPRNAGATGGMVVPEDAVQTVDGRDAVFVRTPAGFEANFVTLGQRSAGRVEIAAGLSPGRQIATRNAFLLKAELGKSSDED